MDSAPEAEITLLLGASVGLAVDAITEQRICTIGHKGAKASHLIIPCDFRVGEETQRLRVLVDTGAEFCIIRTGLFPAGHAKQAERPVRFIVANNTVMEGGDRVLEGTLSMEGVESDTHRPQKVSIPIQVYEAAIAAADMIVSYQWLAKNDILINPKRHGVLLKDDQNLVWVSGEKAKNREPGPMVARVFGDPTKEGFDHPQRKKISRSKRPQKEPLNFSRGLAV